MFRLVPLEGLGDTEVYDLGNRALVSQGHQDIGRFQITMNDPLLMGMLDAPTNRKKQGQSIREGEALPIRISGEGHPIHQFHDEIGATIGLPGIEDPGLARDLAVWLARASGLEGMAAGQQLDLDSTGGGGDLASVELIHRMRTGALIAAALCMGARSGGVAQTELEPVWEAGLQLGIAFQIADDVLDQTADPARLGKSVGKDLEQGKQTALVDATPVEALATARRKVESAVSALRDVGLVDARLEALCFFLVERDH